ncbi:MAG: ABC transporter substrate-binding protein [Rhodospirillales bacterium]
MPRRCCILRGNPGPGLAEAWTRSPDLTEIVLTLRKGAMFHDGTPVDRLAEAALLDHYVHTNPRPIRSRADAIAILRMAA